MTLFDLAQRLVGEIHERPGQADHPFILWCLESTPLAGTLHDEIPWCSSWLNRLAWFFRLPRSKSAAARSWLEVGIPVPLTHAFAAWDIVVFSRGTDPRAGHVAVFVGLEGDHVRVIGGNQSNGIASALFPMSSVLGVRRLREAA